MGKGQSGSFATALQSASHIILNRLFLDHGDEPRTYSAGSRYTRWRQALSIRQKSHRIGVRFLIFKRFFN
jgi:hypothetical protein